MTSSQTKTGIIVAILLLLIVWAVAYWYKQPAPDAQPTTPDTQNTTFNGTMENSCSPVDGLAYTILLDNGITAWIYGNVTIGTYNVSLTPNEDGSLGDGAIILCPTWQTGEAIGTWCTDKSGKIIIDSLDDKNASGRVKIDGTTTQFNVERIQKEMLCG